MNKDLSIPNLGSATTVEVVQLLAQAGQTVKIDDPLCVVESDKSSFDIVSLYDGVIQSISISVGQKISSGYVFGVIAAENLSVEYIDKKKDDKNNIAPAAPFTSAATIVSLPRTDADKGSSLSTLYASPLVRKLARESQILLSQISGTGLYGRITIDDLRQTQSNYRSNISFPPPESSAGASYWGNISIEPMGSIKKIAASRFEQSWKNIPHVTHFDIAYIDDIERFRKDTNAKQTDGAKMTILSMIIKALAATLKEHPTFNSSLSSCGKKLILKENIHIGCAVETTKGLLVPVIKDPLSHSLLDIAEQIKDLAMRARAFQLKPEDYQGQTFTVSSLGGFSGRFFTPIIQWPDVAILGICRSYTELALIDGVVSERLCLPLSLSYDHRVIDGAEAARFSQSLTQYLSDVKNFL